MVRKPKDAGAVSLEVGKNGRMSKTADDSKSSTEVARVSTLAKCSRCVDSRDCFHGPCSITRTIGNGRVVLENQAGYVRLADTGEVEAHMIPRGNGPLSNVKRGRSPTKQQSEPVK